MVERYADQAEGLRRLLASQGPRVVTLVAGRGGVGRTTVVANLALALAALGRRVLAVDGDAAAGNLNDLLRLKARFELAHVLAGDRTLGQVLVRGPGGIDMLPAARGLAQLAGSGGRGGRWLLERLAALGAAPDFVLVDPGAGHGEVLLPADSPAQELLLAVSPDPRSITDGYGLLKRLAWRGALPPCRLLVCQAADAVQAAAIHRNIADVARRHAGIALPLAGWIPADTTVNHALRLQRLVMEAAPGAPLARAVQQLAETLLEPTRHPGGAAGGRMGMESLVGSRPGFVPVAA